MEKTILYMVRHGESEANRRDAYLGFYDLPLTDVGRKQAEMAAEFVQTLGAEVIYASDLSRARNTAFATAKRRCRFKSRRSFMAVERPFFSAFSRSY